MNPNIKSTGKSSLLQRLGAPMLPWVMIAVWIAGTTTIPGPARAQGVGAYFTLVNTYIYANGPGQGARTLVRPRLSFNVVDLRLDTQDRIWFRIVYPSKSMQLKGEGWTAKSPHQLRGTSNQPVLIFNRIPSVRPGFRGQGSMRSYRIPIADLELLNESQAGSGFAQLDWQKVRYKVTEPLLAWARGGAGIYRIGKSEAFLSRVYGEMVTRNVGKEKRIRLLSGVIRIGDTLREAAWALGDPLRRQDEPIGNTKRTIWQYPEMTVIFEKIGRAHV